MTKKSQSSSAKGKPHGGGMRATGTYAVRQLGQHASFLGPTHGVGSHKGERGHTVVLSGKGGQHVVPSNDGWSVKSAGASRATGVFRTQKEAVEKAREIARNQQSDLYIHGRDGRIRDRCSYGKDPLPPKG